LSTPAIAEEPSTAGSSGAVTPREAVTPSEAFGSSDPVQDDTYALTDIEQIAEERCASKEMASKLGDDQTKAKTPKTRGNANAKIRWADMSSDSDNDVLIIEKVPQQDWATKVACKLVGDQAKSKTQASAKSNPRYSWADICSDDDDDYDECPWLAASQPVSQMIAGLIEASAYD
jgi:hypothetical protein